MKYLLAVITISATLLVNISVIDTAYATDTKEHTDTNETNETEESTDLPVVTGEVKKVKPKSGKITIKHGEIENLEMPGMTMVFRINEDIDITQFEKGDNVTFTVIEKEGKMVITTIEKSE